MLPHQHSLLTIASMQNTKTTTRDQLLAAAQSFCTSFAQKAPPEIIFSHFSTSPNVLALEHGLPRLAPFLGREFRGHDGLRGYFDLLAEFLSYENMSFSNYLIDSDQSKVSVRGEARFTWTSTKQSWDEVFTYVLAFDEKYKVNVYEVWADSGAAFLASKGQLQ
jgi:hypothetical protein